MYMAWVRTRRYLRKAPKVAMGRFFEPVFNSGQILTFFAAVIGLALLLHYGVTDAERDALAVQWAITVKAFILALLIWAAISIVTAPFVVARSERLLGKWHGRSFVYSAPQLVATIRCRPGREDQQHDFILADPEQGAMVYCTVEIQPPAPSVIPQVFGMVRLGSAPTPGSYSLFRLEDDRRAHVYFHTTAYASEYTARVYCHQFEMYRAGELPGSF